jgi:hypothetical protein
MTNSASEPGADDVLASIRRLIQATPDRPAGSGGRLLLTPALRVSDPDEEPDDPAPAPRVLTLEDRIAELEAAVGSQATEFEPDGSEVAHLSPPEELVRAVQNLEIEMVDEFVPMTPAPAPVVEVVAEAAPEVAPVAAPRPEPEPQRPARGLFLAVPPQDLRGEGAAEPEAQPQTQPQPVAAVPAGLFFTRHDRPADEAEVAEAAPDAVAEAAADAAADVAVEASPVIDATEAFAAGFPGAFTGGDEPPEDEELHDEAPHQEVEVEDDWQDDAVVAPVWTRHAPPSDAGEAPEPMPAFRHARTAARGGSEPADAASVAPGDAAPAIDDAQLRALIATLLREELQGPLGERITRNIRKLVRREIERALAVRDFD